MRWEELAGDESVNFGTWIPCQGTWACYEAVGEPENQHGEGSWGKSVFEKSSLYGEGEKQMGVRYEG